MHPSFILTDRIQQMQTATLKIYMPSDSASDYELINGYKKVKSTAELKAGGNYLIVTKADTNGGRYVLVPSTGTEKYDHVAKISHRNSFIQ